MTTTKTESTIHGTVRPVYTSGHQLIVVVTGQLDMVKPDCFDPSMIDCVVEAEGQWLVGWNFNVSRWRHLDNMGRPAGDWVLP